ncbi:MAG TPA: DNA topoisomerase IB [Polyangiales bacterium]|jgi:DNA topoisomerase-1|nr:DNA topoisomerase IB [Polyangiales bacterium]
MTLAGPKVRGATVRRVDGQQLPAARLLQLRATSRRAARAAGLRYVDDEAPGFKRAHKGKGFVYSDTHGRVLRDQTALERIRKLAIPPAWTDVWICPLANGHIQATGRDARGRKQYRYHAAWSQLRNTDKHARICEFARLMPKLRKHCRRQLRKPGLGRETVLAALLRIVDLTGIRVGHEEYTRANNSFGLTTLRSHHVRVRGAEVELRYRGKSGVQRNVRFRDARIARLISECRALGGRQLFYYCDEAGQQRSVRAEQLNAYLRELTAPHYSVKDFRTWAATVKVALDLRDRGVASSQRHGRKMVLEAVRTAAEYLGNTPAVCRSSYVHPGVFEAYFEGAILPPDPPRRGAAAHAREAAVLAFLEARVVRRKSGKKTSLEAQLRASTAKIKLLRAG